MAGHDIVVIGGSAGGVEALRRICEGLPSDFPAAVFVVVHISPNSRSIMPDLLSRAGKLPARHPKDDEPINRGVIYVAPPDMHMLLRPGHVILRRGPQENRTRPAINPLFRSAAVTYGSRVIGVVLSGLLDDGCAGLLAIKSCGGVCIVQEPDDAMWSEMPRNALAHTKGRSLRAGRGDAGPAEPSGARAARPDAADPGPFGPGNAYCRAGGAHGA